jgi:nucleoside-diphosphate-sugar epimerase
MEKIVIIGSTGPTGRILTQRLCKAGYPVTVVHRSDAYAAEFESWGAAVVYGDAFERDSYLTTLGKLSHHCDILVNLMGGNPFAEPDTWPDYTGNVNAIDGIVAAGIRRFVFVTSVGTGRSVQYVPEGPRIYGKMLELKSQAEEYLKQTSLDWTILKPGGLGPPDYVIQTGDPLITENHGIRGLIDRHDLANVVLRAMFDDSTIHKELYTVVDRIELFDGEPAPFPLAPLLDGLSTEG